MAKTNPADPVSQNRFIGLAQTFLRMEASGGIALVVMAVLAIIVANSPLYAFYDFFLRQMTFTIGFSDYSKSVDFQIHKPLQLWINDGLMAVFFLLVGLEIKREFVSGELSSRSRALLPFLGAIGGMAVPALIYCYINKDTPPNLAGWAIPSATDIAFALGVLALLGSRAPASLKVLLMAIAVIDDLGAIIIIALFYTEQLSVPPLVFSFLCLGVMALLKMKRVTNVVPYLLVGLVMWASVLESGVHATLAGYTNEHKY
jgi:NhaA family Na+:H+ antiporter